MDILNDLTDTKASIRYGNSDIGRLLGRITLLLDDEGGRRGFVASPCVTWVLIAFGARIAPHTSIEWLYRFAFPLYFMSVFSSCGFLKTLHGAGGWRWRFALEVCAHVVFAIVSISFGGILGIRSIALQPKTTHLLPVRPAEVSEGRRRCFPHRLGVVPKVKNA